LIPATEVSVAAVAWDQLSAWRPQDVGGSSRGRRSALSANWN